MIFFNYTTPRMIVAEQGKHIRAINDVYEPEHYDEGGNLVEEHFPHYSTTIFVPDIYQTIEDVEKDYVEEDIIENE